MEAAAATVVMMGVTSLPPQQEEIKEFIADRPFSFFFYAGGSNEGQILFAGQLMK